MKNLLTAALLLTTPVIAQTLPIIPLPVQSERTEGVFKLHNALSIRYKTELRKEAELLATGIENATGIKPQLYDEKLRIALHNYIEFTTGNSDEIKEAYTLEITSKGVKITGADAAGAFYGAQSLLQLIPLEGSKEIPACNIKDSPRFGWRGMHLDVGRHMFDVKDIKKFIDWLAFHKMNSFHWHLTEDQGWRIEIKKYPKLTSVGGYRESTPPYLDRWGTDGKRYGGFYTQEEIKDIVQYAADRHITIVPEIGMPGHAMAAIAAYPELGTKKEQIDVWAKFGKAYHTYDPSAESTYHILGDVFDEIFELFPSKVLHIGGDEVRFDHWKESKSVQELMKKEKLDTMADVQLYFTNRIAEIVQSKGRNIMGWNEIVGDDLHGFLKGGQTASAAKLDKDTVVHFWKGSPALAKKAIKNGHTIVNSTHSSTYLDYGYGSISLGKAYSFDPIIKGLDSKYHSKIIGFGCQMWGEWIPTVKSMENKVYPRLAAYSEVGWSELEDKNFSLFKERMKLQLKRWDIQGIQYASGQTNVLSASDFFNHVKVGSWSPQETPADWKNQSFATGDKVKATGTYEVAFLYKKGTHALDISEVSLLEDGKVVATDKHTAFSGGSLKNIAYTLKLPTYKAGAKYTIQARIKGSGGTDSHGEVKIQASE